MMRKKIGLLGGSFDPIHVGHLNLAFELMEKRNLDEVWFIPAQLNPLKERDLPHAMDHRLKMVQMAIQDIPQFYLKDLEKNRPPPSYTIDTLRALIEEERRSSNSCQFYLLLGEDAIETFQNWHLPEEIVKLVPLMIGTRRGFIPFNKSESEYALRGYSPLIRHAIQKGFTSIRLMDVSSTDIRLRLIQKKYCGHLVPSLVLDYIEENMLYTQST